MPCSAISPLLILRFAEAVVGTFHECASVIEYLFHCYFYSCIGRLNPSRLGVIVPAHFVGCIIAATLYKSVVSYVPATVNIFRVHFVCSLKQSFIYTLISRLLHKYSLR